MDEPRYYAIEKDDDWQIPEDEREYSAAAPEDEVPFHIPRD